MPHAVQFGFFLNCTRFEGGALLPYPIGSHARPSPALLSAVYLWGVRLSCPEEARSSYEARHLSSALHHAANALASDHPDKIIHGIQAEVLLCVYFFTRGRILEGKYHLSAAVSLVLGSRLHQQRSSGSPSVQMNLLGVSNPLSAPPRDQIEEGERINAFWTVYTLNNIWGIASGCHSNAVFEGPGLQIDTPWPLCNIQYEQASSQSLMDEFTSLFLVQNTLPTELRSSNTVKNFLLGISSVSSLEYSANAFLAKASILFERASSLSFQFHPSMYFSIIVSMRRF